jgi:hypothetical protein
MPRGKKLVWSISDLERLLVTRRSAIQKLTKQRTKVQRKLDSIDREIASLGGSSNGGGGGTRVKNDMSLVATLGAVLKGKEAMGVGDIVDAVKSHGYRSNSANFRGIVNQTLIKESQFASAGRGLYKLKK